MPTTSTSAVATPTACGVTVYELPVKDAACGAVLNGNMSDVFDSCCKGDSPVKYDNDCGIYCLAQGQTVDKLQSCLTSKSNDYRDVFCNDKLNATATAAATSVKSTSTGTSTGTSTASTATSTKNAAVLNQSVSKTGLGLVAMLFCSALAGVIA